MRLGKHYSNMEEGGRGATTVQTRALLRLRSPSAAHWSVQHLQHHAGWTATHGRAALTRWGCRAADAALHSDSHTCFLFYFPFPFFYLSPDGIVSPAFFFIFFFTDVDSRFIYSWLLSPSLWSVIASLCRLTLREEAVFFFCFLFFLISLSHHRCSDSQVVLVSPGLPPVESTGMTDSNAAARVTGSGSISCSVPRQQASPPDHRVPLPAPRCPPVPRRLLWHDSSGKEEEDQGLQARVPAGILEERAHGSGQWGYSHNRNSCDTLLNPCRVFCLVAWSLQRGQSPGHEQGSRLLTQRDWTWTLEPPLPPSHLTQALLWLWSGPTEW